MSKLAKKFLLSLSAVLILVILCSLYLNSNFIERFFLYQEKHDLMRVCTELTANSNLEETITRLENTEDVLIVQVENTDDNELLNTRLRTAYQAKGVGFRKLWLWEADQQVVKHSKTQMRLYGQEKLRYSLLVAYVELDDIFVAAVKIIPNMEPTIALVNLVTAAVFSCAAFVMILCIFFLVKKITSPLTAIGNAAKSIAALDFKTVAVKTGDELEILADDINDMSGKLKAAHIALEAKNVQMEALLANVSHDLKTPVSLIKAYASGIRDGMDDGTFLDTIILQNEKMAQMIERLLALSKVQSEITVEDSVDLSALLSCTVSEHRLQAKDRGIAFVCEISPDMIQAANRQVVQTIFDNLISNAVKYAAGGSITIRLKRDSQGCLFQIQNEINPGINLEPERLWEPFYVAEESRNKNLSGTGLGLAIVRAAAQKYGYTCACELSDGKIQFTVDLSNGCNIALL